MTHGPISSFGRNTWPHAQTAAWLGKVEHEKLTRVANTGKFPSVALFPFYYIFSTFIRFHFVSLTRSIFMSKVGSVWRFSFVTILPALISSLSKTESTSSATRAHLLPHLCWKRRGRGAGWAFQARDSPDITDRVSGVLGKFRPSTVHSLFFRDNWHILKTAILLHLYMHTQARAAAGGPEARRGEGFLKLGPASRHLPALAFQLHLALRFRRRFKVSLMERVYEGGGGG